MSDVGMLTSRINADDYAAGLSNRCSDHTAAGKAGGVADGRCRPGFVCHSRSRLGGVQ